MTIADEVERPEGYDEVVSRGPCPQCDTLRRFVTYADGHSHCFKCKHHVDGSDDEKASHHYAKVKTPRVAIDPLPGAAGWGDLTKRKITSKTMRKYGYFLGGYNGQTVQVSSYYIDAATIGWQKARHADKTFPTIKVGDHGTSIVDCWLFGRHVYGDRFDRRVVVLEGEIDALTVAQVLDFKCAVVSVNGGSDSAARCLKSNYLWLDRFQEIVIWFDADEPGKKATEECAKLFKVGKVRVAKAPAGFKDASDLMQADRPGDIEAAIYTATAWRPKGIVNAADNSDDVKAPRDDDDTSWGFTWPWEPMNDMLGPIKPGHVTYHVAGTGVGKTSGVAEIAYHLHKQGCTIGWLGFEDTRRETKLRFLSIHVSDRLDLDPRPDPEMAALHEDLFGDGHFWLFDQETAEWSVEAIFGYIRYCAKALDCKVIFIDPLSFIVAGTPASESVAMLDRVARDLAALAKELGVNLQISHHLKRTDGAAHEEGAATSINELRGSGSLANFASIVIGHERNQQAEDGQETLTQLRSLKNRPRSKTGVIMVLDYDYSTGRLLPTKRDFPGPQTASHGARRGQQRFGPVPTGGPPQSTDY